MAQNTVQGQSTQVQTYILRRPYRSTDMGGVSITYILANGMFIRPTRSERSRSGNHGTDTWVLEPGRYTIVDIQRPNLKNGPKPFHVTVQCTEVSNGSLSVLSRKEFYTMSLEDAKNLAKVAC